MVADFGCGEALIAQSITNKVYSFDLIAKNKFVTACNMAKVGFQFYLSWEKSWEKGINSSQWKLCNSHFALKGHQLNFNTVIDIYVQLPSDEIGGGGVKCSVVIT